MERASCVVRLIDEVLAVFKKNHVKRPVQLAHLSLEHLKVDAPLVGGVRAAVAKPLRQSVRKPRIP